MKIKKEWIFISLAIILMTIILMSKEKIPVLNSLIYSILIILISILGKNLTAHVRHIEIKHEVWKFKQFWFWTMAHFKKPIPVGVILPLLFAIPTAGGSLYSMFPAFLQYKSKALPSKVSKRLSNWRYAEIMEWDLALISFFGFAFLIILSLFSFWLGFPILAKLSLFYAVINAIPISTLDGSKLFFGSFPLYITTLILFAVNYLIIML